MTSCTSTALNRHESVAVHAWDRCKGLPFSVQGKQTVKWVVGGNFITAGILMHNAVWEHLITSKGQGPHKWGGLSQTLAGLC